MFYIFSVCFIMADGTGLTNKAFGNMKASRTKLKEALRTLQQSVEEATTRLENRNQTALRRLKQEMERKWEAYENYHEKCLASGSEAQLAAEAYEDLINAEHGLLRRDHDNALGVIQEASYTIEEIDKAHKESQANIARETAAAEAKTNRIEQMRTAIDEMYTAQDLAITEMKNKARAAETYGQLANIQSLYFNMLARLKIIDRRVKELVAMDSELYVRYDGQFSTAQQTLESEFITAKASMRTNMAASEHSEALYGIYGNSALLQLPRPTPSRNNLLSEEVGREVLLPVVLQLEQQNSLPVSKNWVPL